MVLGVVKNVLPKADGYNYMQEAATWINDNNTENAPVFYDELTGRLFSRAKIMSDLVLGKYLEEFAVQSLLLTFVYVIVSKIISATGFINIILAGLTTKNRLSLLEPKAYSALRFAIIISLIDMALIITKVFVLSGRYVVGLTLLLLVLAAFHPFL